MGYERYPRGTNPQGYYDRSDTDYGRDYTYSSAREFEAAGETGDQGQRSYGSRDYGNQRYAQRDGGRGYGGGSRYYGGDRDDGQRSYGGRDEGRDYRASGYQGGANQSGGYRGGYQDRGHSSSQEYHGSYGSDGRRFEDVGRYRHADDDNYRDDGQRRAGANRSYGNRPQNQDQQDRGFFQRAGDEVRSWFGDDDAERRREADARHDERYQGRDFGSSHRDSDYHGWRAGQIASLDRDYDEYRQENRSRFESEFSTWRTQRQGQRDQLSRVSEHMDVVGSDGEHVGTVDKVRGDRILLTKKDADAGGRHHSIPSRWIDKVDGKVTLSKSAAEAKQQWQDEENNQAMFRYGDNTDRGTASQASSGASAGSTTGGAAGSATSTAKTY